VTCIKIISKLAALRKNDLSDTCGFQNQKVYYKRMKLAFKYFSYGFVFLFVFLCLTMAQSNGLNSSPVSNLSAGQGLGSGSIVVSWECEFNANIAYFDVFRSTSSGDYGQSVNPEIILLNQDKTRTYKYEDKALFKTNTSGGIFYYLVRIVYIDGSSVFSSSVTVSFTSSTTKRTWGSIKAMFR
jgi:hypothetical protein